MRTTIIGELTSSLSSVTTSVRQRVWTYLLLGAALLTASSLLLLEPTAVRWPVALVTLGVALVAVLLAAVGRAQTLLGPVTPTLVAVHVFGLVLATGGASSHYMPYYPLLLALVAAFCSRRQLAVTASVVVVLVLGPLVVPLDASVPSGRLVDVLVRLVAWLVFAAVIAHLVGGLRRRNELLREQEQWYRSLFDHNPEAVFSLDPEGRFTSVNPEACRLLGMSREEVLGAPFERFLLPEETGPTSARFLAGLEGLPQRYETAMVDGEGRRVDLAIVNVPIVVHGRVAGIYGVAKDVSTLKAVQAALAEQALHDQLTGLANRRLLARRMQEALAERCNGEGVVALLLLDLDGFKQVNDTLGHAAGDVLLVEATARLRRCTRVGDTLARVGGDEFVLLLPRSGREEAAAVAERMQTELSAPVAVGDRWVSVGASIGIAVVTAGTDVDELLRQADDAMYAAKRSGRGRYRLFHPDLLVPERLAGVRVAEAQAWRGYMAALRAEIAEQQRIGTLPPRLRAPHAVHRTLEQVLAAIDDLPARQLAGDLALPDRAALEEFVYHQTAVQHWADALARRGVLSTQRPAAADQFWARMTGAADDVSAGTCAQVA